MTQNVRVIARIDVKNESAIKGIHLEGLRKVGDPNRLAFKYYEQGVDELLFMDAVAAYYDRNSLSQIIQAATKDVFIPITVGGGIRSIEDITTILEAGADKVAINTQAFKSISFLKDAVNYFGSQCIVSSIDAKKVMPGVWHAYFDNGRETSGRNVKEWLYEVQSAGVGEIILTSIDQEGTRRGFDYDLVKVMASEVSVPLQICGGGGKLEHCEQLCSTSGVDAVVLASMLHYDICNVADVKSAIATSKIRGF